MDFIRFVLYHRSCIPKKVVENGYSKNSNTEYLSNHKSTAIYIMLFFLEEVDAHLLTLVGRIADFRA